MDHDRSHYAIQDREEVLRRAPLTADQRREAEQSGDALMQKIVTIARGGPSQTTAADRVLLARAQAKTAVDMLSAVAPNLTAVRLVLEDAILHLRADERPHQRYCGLPDCRLNRGKAPCPECEKVRLAALLDAYEATIGKERGQ